jgi:hypothetical protein
MTLLDGLLTLVCVAFHKVWCSWSVPVKIDNSLYHLLLGNIIGSQEEGPPSTTNLHPCCFYYEKQPLDIFRTFIIFYLFGLKDVDLGLKVFIYLLRFLNL